MRVRIGQLEVLLDSMEELDALVDRYGGLTATLSLLAPSAANGHAKPAKPPRLAKREQQGDGEATPSPEAVLDLLKGGPRRIDSICNHFGCSPDWLRKILSHTWFERDGQRWTLSSDGHVAANADREC